MVQNRHVRNFQSLGSILGTWIILGAWGMAQSAEQTSPRVIEMAPARIIQDPYPTFNGIAMDVEKGEVIMTDDNRASVLTYSGQFNPTDNPNEPRRLIEGPLTHLGYVCGVALSPEANELYTVDNDWMDNLTVHPLDGDGDIAPIRELDVDHSAWGIFLDSKHDELFITIQALDKISVYPRMAQGADEPIRFIQGLTSGLANPHGIFVDVEADEIFVANHGDWNGKETGQDAGTLFMGPRARLTGRVNMTKPLGPSTGAFFPPSITVHSRTAAGNAAPLRVIQGPRTGLNWPNGIHLDPINNQIVVANSGNDSVLVFDRNANGNVAPTRVISGPHTGLDSPSGVFVDPKRRELWVTNWDNHTATAYSLMADGDVPPLRTIRSAPADAPIATGFGNPGHVVYDPKRKEILVPN